MEERLHVPMMSVGDANIDYQRQCLKCSEKNVMPIKTSKMISKDMYRTEDHTTAQKRPCSSELQLTVQVLGEKMCVSAHQLFSPWPKGCALPPSKCSSTLPVP